MKLNVDFLRSMLVEEAHGKYSELARLLKLDVALLYRIINNQSNAGLKTISRIMDYCKNNSKDYSSLIFLD